VAAQLVASRAVLSSTELVALCLRCLAVPGRYPVCSDARHGAGDCLVTTDSPRVKASLWQWQWRSFADCSVSRTNGPLKRQGDDVSHRWRRSRGNPEILEKLTKWNYRKDVALQKLKTNLDAKNGVFWDITPCGSCNNRRFGGI
jgi:hypothetical protein